MSAALRNLLEPEPSSVEVSARLATPTYSASHLPEAQTRLRRFGCSASAVCLSGEVGCQDQGVNKP